MTVLFTVFYPSVHKVDLAGYAQGTSWSITYYHTDSSVAKPDIDSVLLELDKSLSIYRETSIINRFNHSEKGLQIDSHLRAVVASAKNIHDDTKGLFDITIKPLTDAWGFGVNPIYGSIPDSSIIAQYQSCIGHSKLKFKSNILSKSASCVQIDVNGIAQGYSVDVIAEFLKSRRIHNFIVELGGEVRVHGKKIPGKSRMKVGIQAPAISSTGTYLINRIIELEDGAITTSGSYQKYVESDGKKYSHLLNPFTGYPVNNEMISVSVIAPTAMVADGYDNALMLMGVKDGIDFIEKRKSLAAYFIYRKPNGEIADSLSSRFPRFIN